jgi:hypothetical protein
MAIGEKNLPWICMEIQENQLFAKKKIQNQKSIFCLDLLSSISFEKLSDTIKIGSIKN